MSGVPIRRAKFVAYTLSGLLAAIGGLFLTFFTYSGEASAASGNTYTLFSIAAVVLGGVSLFGGSGSAIGAIFGALMFRTIGDLLFVFNLDPLWQPLFQGVVLLRRSASARRGCSGSATGWNCSMSDESRSRRLRDAAHAADRSGRSRSRSRCIVVLLLVGSLYSRSFLSPEYLLQQLKVASFLGVIATGMMIVDPARPDRPVAALGGRGRRHDVDGGDRLGDGSAHVLAIPFGIACGVALGLVNGFGVAYLRIPSMIVTLAINAVAQGLMVVHTGGFSPQDSCVAGDAHARHGLTRSRPAERADRLGGRRRRRDLPADPHDLRPRCLRDRQPRARRLSLGRRHAARRDDRVRDLPAASRRSAACCSPAMRKAAQAMGDAYLLPAIAAVVLGGTSILGGRGTYSARSPA